MSSWFKVFRSSTKLVPKEAPTATQSSQSNISGMAALAILNNGLKIPRIGLGTYGVKDKSVCLSLFNDAIKVGYRVFDTGTLYGNEEYIGDVLYDKLSSQEFVRNDFYIITKIAPDQHGKGNVNQAVNDCLKRLKLSFLDMVLVHWPGVAKVPPGDPKNKILRKETWQTLEDLVSSGKIKSIGVSNYNEKHLEDLLGYCKLKPTVNQVEFHPMCYQKSLLEFCKSNSICLQAYSSLGSSQGKPPGCQVLFADATVNKLAKKYNKTIPQILLRWGYQHECLLIPKTSKRENLEPNLQIFDFELSVEDMKDLNGMNRNKHFCWNPESIV